MWEGTHLPVSSLRGCGGVAVWTTPWMKMLNFVIRSRPGAEGLHSGRGVSPAVERVFVCALCVGCERVAWEIHLATGFPACRISLPKQSDGIGVTTTLKGLTGEG